MFQARWVFVQSFLLLRNHFGFKSIQMIASEAGFRLPDELVAALSRHDSRAVKKSAYYKDPLVKEEIQRRAKERAALEAQCKLLDKKTGRTFHGYGSAKFTPGATGTTAGSVKKKRKLADGAFPSSSSASSSASSSDDRSFFCEVCETQFDFDSTDYYRRNKHYETKGHKGNSAKYLKKRRSEE